METNPKRYSDGGVHDHFYRRMERWRVRSRGEHRKILEFQTPVGTLTLERDLETLKVNGKVLEKGAQVKMTNILGWYPPYDCGALY